MADTVPRIIQTEPESEHFIEQKRKGMHFPAWHQLALGGIALISIFIAATVAAKVRGLDITCGCFGHASKNWSFSTHLALDLVLLGALLFLVRKSPG